MQITQLLQLLILKLIFDLFFLYFLRKTNLGQSVQKLVLLSFTFKEGISF